MSDNQILTGCEIRKVADGAASGTTAVASSVIDTAGCDSVVFCARIATKDAGNYLSVAQGNAADLSDGADLEGAKVTAANNGEVVAVEITKPTKRYLKATLTRTVATVTGDMFCIRKVKKQPAANNVANSIVSEIHATPAEGTA